MAVDENCKYWQCKRKHPEQNERKKNINETSFKNGVEWYLLFGLSVLFWGLEPFYNVSS